MSAASRASGATLALIVLSVMVGVSAPASAGIAEDGLWYFDQAHIGDHHAAGWTGEGVTIAVLDSPINTSVPTLQGANVTVREPSFCTDETGEFAPAVSADIDGPWDAAHGTQVASLIAGTGAGYPGQAGVKGVAPGATLLYYATSQKDGEVAGGELLSCLDGDGHDVTSEVVNAAMNEALDAGADIISISAGLPAGAFIDDSFIRALREGVVVIGGVSNNDVPELSMHWPAGGNGAIGVQAADAAGTINSTDGLPNWNNQTTVIAPGLGILTQGQDAWEQQRLSNGTSWAAPTVAGFLALVKQKYPQATGNQLIQTLIHNTWAEDHDLEFDQDLLTGYGYASATHMLRVDPTQYPDENPLITADGVPTLEEITNWVPPAAEPGSEAELTPAPDAGPVAGLLLVGLAVLLLLVALIVLIVVLAVRRSRRTASDESKG